MGILDEALGNEKSSILDEALTEQPQQKVATVQPQEDTFISNVGRDWKERLNIIQDPTYLKPGLMNVEQNTLRLGGQVAGGISDVATQGLRSAYRSFVPQKAQDVISDVGRAIMETPVVSKAVEDIGMAWKGFSEEHPDLSKNVEAGLNIASVTPAKMFMPKGLKLSKAVAKETGAVVNDTTNLFERVINPVTESAIDKEIKNVVTENINKSIKTSNKGKQTLPLIQKYFDNAETGIKEIVGNKANINLTNDVGDIVKGVLPENRMQMAEAIHQTEKKLFQEYDSMMQASGKKGATLDLEPIAKQLDEVITNEALLKSKDGIETIAHAKELQDILRSGKTSMSPQAAQDWIANANNRLMNKNLNYLETSKAGVDAGVASMMRKQLDKLIESTEGAGYQDIKNRYGAVRSLREGTNKAAFASMAEKNMPNFFDITSGTALVHGLISMNPATVAGATFMEGLNAFRRKMFNPDTYVKKMFADVDNLMTKGSAFEPDSVTISKAMDMLSNEKGGIKGSPAPLPKLRKSPYTLRNTKGIQGIK